MVVVFALTVGYYSNHLIKIAFDTEAFAQADLGTGRPNPGKEAKPCGLVDPLPLGLVDLERRGLFRSHFQSAHLSRMHHESGGRVHFALVPFGWRT